MQNITKGIGVSHSRKDFIFSNKAPSQGDLKTILKRSAKTAKNKGYQAFLYIKAQGCQPCSLIEKNADNPLLREIFRNCYFIKIDYFKWLLELKKNHLEIETAPFFIRISDDGEITDYMYAAGDWDEDTPESMVINLKPYFSDRTEKNRLNVTKQMVCKKLYWDVFSADFDAIKYAVLTTGCNVHLLAEDGSSYLHLASSIRKKYAKEEEIIQIVKFFIQEGVDVNFQNKAGQTALNNSVHQRNYNISEFLIKNGADSNIPDNKGETPLHRTVFDAHFSLSKLLLENGADVNKIDSKGFTPLHYLPTYDISLAKHLLDSGASINTVDNDGNTPFHFLIAKLEFNDEAFDFVKLFVEKGADVSLKNSKGLTPIEVIKSFPPKPHLEKVVNYLQKI